MTTIHDLIGIAFGLLVIMVLIGLCFLTYEAIEALRVYVREHGGNTRARSGSETR